jgi:hypothetical protein
MLYKQAGSRILKLILENAFLDRCQSWRVALCRSRWIANSRQLRQPIIAIV